ncbi:MAG: hypothetical protein OQL06_07170 [Gammaproteobacteria bacterium]|nr:hypothetical protein [Gammaproteobacteria bacterium]
MNFLDFNPAQYKSIFADTVKTILLSLQSVNDNSSASARQMIAAMESTIEIMQRADADKSSSSIAPLTEADVSQIGDYALNLLDEISIIAANKGLQSEMLMLHRLSLPVALWLASHGGKINKLDIVVNAVASYANELKQSDELIILCDAINRIISSVSDDIRQDIEATNPMRPWRILNLNWGIVATRSHSAEVMEQVFEQLVKNIPADARQFFQEGMQQMDIIGYPDHVRDVMEKYSKLWGDEDSLH